MTMALSSHREGDPVAHSLDFTEPGSLSQMAQSHPSSPRDQGVQPSPSGDVTVPIEPNASSTTGGSDAGAGIHVNSGAGVDSERAQGELGEGQAKFELGKSIGKEDGMEVAAEDRYAGTGSSAGKDIGGSEVLLASREDLNLGSVSTREVQGEEDSVFRGHAQHLHEDAVISDDPTTRPRADGAHEETDITDWNPLQRSAAPSPELDAQLPPQMASVETGTKKDSFLSDSGRLLFPDADTDIEASPKATESPVISRRPSSNLRNLEIKAIPPSPQPWDLIDPPSSHDNDAKAKEAYGTTIVGSSKFSTLQKASYVLPFHPTFPMSSSTVPYIHNGSRVCRSHRQPRSKIPKSSYYFGPPPSGSAYGTPPTGQIGVHHPREILRVERDYTGGELMQFAPIYPLELEGRVRTIYLVSISLP